MLLLLSVIVYLELFPINCDSFCFYKVQYVVKYTNLVVLKLIKKLHYQLWLNKVEVERYHTVKKY